MYQNQVKLTWQSKNLYSAVSDSILSLIGVIWDVELQPNQAASAKQLRENQINSHVSEDHQSIHTKFLDNFGEYTLKSIRCF